MSKTVYKYDKRIRRWYRETDGKRYENLKLGVGYNTANGQYQFNSDGTKTKLNPSSSKPKNNYVNWSQYDFTNTKPTSSLSTVPLIERAVNLDLQRKGPKIPYKPSREVQQEYARREQEARRYQQQRQQKKKGVQRINDSSEVREWGQLERYKKQLDNEANTWSDQLNEQYSRKRDARSVDRGYKIKLVDGVNQMGKPAKYYYFYNPKTGELGNKVSKYYLKDNGYNMKGVTPVVFENTHDAQMVSQHKNTTHRDLIKKATNNIDHSSYDVFNHVTGGIFNITPSNVYGGIRGGFRKDQSFLGAVNNTLFGYDPINPEKSGNLGFLETTDDIADWGVRHPMATAAINTVGDMAIGYGMNKALKMSSPRVGTRTAKVTTARTTNELLGRLGRWSEGVKQTSKNLTNQVGSKALNTIKKVPGGNMASSTGKRVLNTGRNTLGSLKTYRNRAIQYIPQRTRQRIFNNWNRTRNFFGKFTPEGFLDQGLKRTTGYGLTSDAKAGAKFLRNAYSFGQAGYGVLKGNDADPLKLGKVLPYVPGITYFYKPYNLYYKYDTAMNTVDNINDIYDDGLTAERAYDIIKGTADIVGK